MRNWFPVLFVLVVTRSVAAQDTDSSEPGPPVSALDDLAVLLDTPLPGEQASTDQQGAAAVDPLDALIGRRIREVVALNPPPGFDPVADMKMPLGGSLSRSDVRLAVMRLWETGRYRDIQIFATEDGPSGVILQVKVTPMFRIVRIEQSGNKALDEAAIRRALGFIPGTPVVPDTASMMRLRDKLIAEYRRRGYGDAKVVMRLETTEVAGEVVLVITVNEGAPDRYSVIRLLGLPEDVDTAVLLRRANLKKGLIRDTEQLETALEELLLALSELGYYDAAVIGAPIESRLTGHDFELVISLNPGLRTELAFSGRRRIARSDLEDILKQKDARRTLPQSVAAAGEYLRQYAVSRGFLHARVDAERFCHLNDGNTRRQSAAKNCPQKTAWQTLDYRIAEGAAVEVDSIEVEGNAYFTDTRIKEEIFAWMTEKNASATSFTRFSSRALDESAGSPPELQAAEAPRGSRVPIDRGMRIYVPEFYQEVSRHIVGLYMEKGFLKAEVTHNCDVRTLRSKASSGSVFRPFVYHAPGTAPEEGASPCLFIHPDGTSLLAQFSISEGIQTLLTGLSVTGNTPTIFSEVDILKVGGLAINQPYNEYFLRQAAESIRKAYAEKGYLFADISWRSSVSPDGAAAEAEIQIIEGPKVKIKKIIINSEVTRHWFIRNNLGLKKGDPITPSAIASAERRLMDMGLFNSATVSVKSPKTVAAEKIIEVTIIDRKPQYLELRGGFATEEGVRGGFQYGHRNMFGLGLGFRLLLQGNYRVWFLGPEGQEFEQDLEERYDTYNATADQKIPRIFGKLEWNILTGLTSRHVPGTKGFLGAGVDMVFRNLNRRGYSAVTVSPVMRLNTNVPRMFPIELKTAIEGSVVIPSTSEEAAANNALDSFSRMPSGRALFWVSTLSLGFDLRDNPFNPHRGFYAGLSTDYVQTIGDDQNITVEEIDENGNAVTTVIVRRSQYLKPKLTLSGYIPLGSVQNVFALSGSGGYIFHLRDNSTAWADRYFYMGGVSTLRGFAADSVVAQDVYYTIEDDPEADESLGYGGESMVLIRAELRHDFGGNLIGVVFGEAGNIWRDNANFMRAKDGDFAPWIVRPVAGLGIHYDTPVGPIAFDVGFNLNRRPFESIAAWYFSIGSAF